MEKKYKKKSKEFQKNLVVLLISLVVCLIVVEIAIRVIGRYENDGQFLFMGMHRPYKLPYLKIKDMIEEYEKSNQSYIIYDKYLGWTIANNSWHSNGLYFSNSIGIRSNKEFNISKENNKTRIALFGDSFIHSDDVFYNESLAFHIEYFFNKSNESVEVMNFGVGGYGIDQSYLRWKLLGKNYKPDIVIIGFQPENCKRNLNIIRSFYMYGTKIPFSKPRFIIKDNELELINYPTEIYKNIPEIVKNFNSWNLSKYEYFYDKNDYEKNYFFNLKFISLIDLKINKYKELKKEKIFYDTISNESLLCYKIIENFYNEAKKESKVYILHLPKKEDIDYFLRKKEFIYTPILEKLKKDFFVIDPSFELIEIAKKEKTNALFKGHYNNKSNFIIANFTYKYLKYN